MRNPTFFWLVSLSFSASKKGLRQMVSQVLNHAAWTPKKGKEDIHYLTICYLHYNYKMIIYAADYLRFTHCGKTLIFGTKLIVTRFHQFGFSRPKRINLTIRVIILNFSVFFVWGGSSCFGGIGILSRKNQLKGCIFFSA